MIQKIILLINIIISLVFYSSFAQNQVERVSNEIYNKAKKIPQEKIFVHFNSSFITTGENLFYKIYCIDTESQKLSNISKVAYIELIDANKKSIFKHKVKLKDGVGQGDFYTPNSALTGNYKLVAYTQWMRNGRKNNFFQNDISIINPYTDKQVNDKYGFIIIDTLQVSSKETLKVEKNLIINQNNNQHISFKFNKKSFSNREKVTLTINSLNGEKSYGNYSISVRKIDSIQTFAKYTAYTYSTQFSTKLTSIENDKFYLPEIRGEIIKGKVILKGSSQPVSDIKVALSIPGPNYIFKIANTNEEGIFYFNIIKEYENDNASIQIIEQDRENYEIEIEQQTNIDYSGLTFKNSLVPIEIKNLILEQSINNQIENAYRSIRLDSIYKSKANTFYKSDLDNEYVLDDYTRFPTVKETFVEIINDAWISNENGKNIFRIRNSELSLFSNHLPLVLIDGQVNLDHNKLIEYDAKKIKKITIHRNNYVHGSYFFQGMISVETYNGNYRDDMVDTFAKNIQLSRPLPQKKYYNQTYNENNESKRIPDYRTQLLWKPNFILNKGDTFINFFTSDINGTYEISLEGFTVEGQPISIKDTIYVNK